MSIGFYSLKNRFPNDYFISLVPYILEMVVFMKYVKKKKKKQICKSVKQKRFKKISILIFHFLKARKIMINLAKLVHVKSVNKTELVFLMACKISITRKFTIHLFQIWYYRLNIHGVVDFVEQPKIFKQVLSSSIKVKNVTFCCY